MWKLTSAGDSYQSPARAGYGTVSRRRRCGTAPVAGGCASGYTVCVRRLGVAGGAILLLAVALRLPGLDEQSLWTDEVYSAESARWPLPVLLTVQDGHPPLFGLVLKALDRVHPSDLHGRF